MSTLQRPTPALSALLDLLLPRICAGCGKSISGISAAPVCLLCLHQLPHTGFASLADNPIEKIFSGRIDIRSAHSEFYYSQESVIRTLIHELKYKGKKDIGIFLGSIIGRSLKNSMRFSSIDLLVPLPLYPDREYKRGYNQSELICAGISQILSVPVESESLARVRNTTSQTKKHRTERWVNMENSFKVLKPEKLFKKHVLLVDDVITTGASVEACAQALQDADITSLSIATIAFASK